ncbi:MAG: enoyl-CoA hydratase/isomerase family protein [Dehalococcoidia bacterium]
MVYEHIMYEVEDRTAVITLNRPERLNSISRQMMREINEAYRAAEDDDDVWTILVTATGRAFCTGADVQDQMLTASDEQYLGKASNWDAPQEITPPYLQMTKPFICAVNGICCGAGLDMVTTSDIVIASEDATFFDPHVTIGIVSGREMVRLARVLPLNITMRLALMGRHERMSAQRAYELGLVSELVPGERLLERAKEIAAIVNSNAPLAVRGTRLAIRKSLSLPVYEAELLSESYRMRVAVSEDAKEGPRAFAEKRAPEWKAQ